MSIQPPRLPRGRAIGEARRRTWMLTGFAVAILVVNLLRSNDSGDWLIAAVAALGGVILSIFVLKAASGADGRRATAASTKGALFGATGIIRLSEARHIPLLSTSFSRAKKAAFTHGMVTGTLIIDSAGISWTPNKRALRLNVPRVSFPRGQINEVDTGGLPGWGNSAALAVRLIDGSTITFQTRRLQDLRSALERGGYQLGEV